MGKISQKYKMGWEKELDGCEADGIKTKIGDWCTKSHLNEFSAHCKLCNVIINVRSMGKKSLM